MDSGHWWCISTMAGTLNWRGKILKKPLSNLALIYSPLSSIGRRLRNCNCHILKLPGLNLVDYKYSEVKELIKKELEWRDYGGKHYESVWTRFYQGYILPVKFHIDKRKAHLSNLIYSGQTTKEKAVEQLKQPMYNEQLLKQDLDFVLRKFGFSKEEFEEIIKRPR